MLTILLPVVAADACANGAATEVRRLKALVDGSFFLPGFDCGDADIVDDIEASDRRLAAADNTGILSDRCLSLMTQRKGETQYYCQHELDYAEASQSLMLLLLLMGCGPTVSDEAVGHPIAVDAFSLLCYRPTLVIDLFGDRGQ